MRVEKPLASGLPGPAVFRILRVGRLYGKDCTVFAVLEIGLSLLLLGGMLTLAFSIAHVGQLLLRLGYPEAGRGKQLMASFLALCGICYCGASVLQVFGDWSHARWVTRLINLPVVLFACYYHRTFTGRMIVDSIRLHREIDIRVRTVAAQLGDGVECALRLPPRDKLIYLLKAEETSHAARRRFLHGSE